MVGEPDLPRRHATTDKNKLGGFKPIADFDWAWPMRLDRDAVEAAVKLDFLEVEEHLGGGDEQRAAAGGQGGVPALPTHTNWWSSPS